MQKTDELVLASVGNRFLANLIDNIVIGLLTFLIASLAGIPIVGLNIEAMNADPEAFKQLYLRFLMVAIPVSLLYRFLQESSPRQATLGKRIMKLRVVKVTGANLTIWDSLLRNVVKELSGYLYMIYLVGLFNPLHQCVHDVAARTYVVDNV